MTIPYSQGSSAGPQKTGKSAVMHHNLSNFRYQPYYTHLSIVGILP